MSQPGNTGGIATALAMLGVRGAVDGDADVQAEMFEADAAMPSLLPPDSPTRTGAGRRAGVPNRSTEAWRALFTSKFRHPMMVLGELTSMTPEQLARELKLYVYHEGKPVLGQDGKEVLATGEALKVQKDAAVALLPYLAQKLPMAVEVTPPRRGVVVIGELPIGDGADDEFALPLPPNGQSKQNQQVIEGESVRLEQVQSDDAAKPQTTLGDFKDDV